MKNCAFLIFTLFFLTANSQSYLKNEMWILSKIEDKKNNTSLLLDNKYSFLKFSDSTYVGYGCNGFSGKYKVFNNKITFIGGMLKTDQGCKDPEDYKAENYIMSSFMQLEYVLKNDSLILSKDEQTIFTYTKQKQKGKGK